MKTYIPEVSPYRISRLSQRIRPVIRFNARGEQDKTGVPYFIKPCNITSVSYIWEPKRTTPAPTLIELQRITTYHRFSYYGFFKPSIAEVLAQIPKELLDTVTAFEILDKPESIADVCREQRAFNAGYHVAVTALYRFEKKQTK